MAREVVSLKRLSICPCGYSVLDESIHIGTKYTIDRSTLRGGASYICGGCGGIQRDVFVVNASSALNPAMPLRPLPAELFLDTQ